MHCVSEGTFRLHVFIFLNYFPATYKENQPFCEFLVIVYTICCDSMWANQHPQLAILPLAGSKLLQSVLRYEQIN